MSRLDRHISAVRNKLTLEHFLHGLAWASAIFAAMVWLAILVQKLFAVHPPRPDIFIFSGLGAVVLTALVYSIWRRPTPHQAAVAIDEKLALKEKFSTALYIRPSNDPFAMAAVRDAEQTADNVSLQKRFPVTFPTAGYSTMLIAALAILSFFFLPTADLFGKQQQSIRQQAEAEKAAGIRKVIERAQVKVDAVPKTAASEEAIKLAKTELANMLAKPPKDADAARLSAFKAIQNMDQAIKQQIKDSDHFAESQNDDKMFRSMSPPTDEKGPVADAHRDLIKGDYAKAVDHLRQAADNFKDMTPEEKEKAAKQMKDLANQLKKAAEDPKTQEQMEKQLQAMGADKQQAKQMADDIKKAAQGDKQAQQNLQKQAQQVAQQMNNGNGPTQAQQQQINQMMKQMQGAAGAQAQAQAMQQAAQQMAQGMQQAAQQKGGSQPGPGQQPGQGDQVAQGMQQMQEKLDQMDAINKDAEAMAEAGDASKQAADDAAGQCDGNGDKDGKNGKGGTSQWKEGNPDKKGNGMGGPGIGNGGVASKEQAPFTVKTEKAPTQNIDNGKILAAHYVKAKSIKGESHVELGEAAAAAEQDATDEVDQDRISPQSQKAVRDYFKSMQDDAKEAPAGGAK